MSKAKLIGERLDKIIEEQGITKSKLAEISGVTPQAVNNWYKTGKIGIESAMAIGSLYGYAVDWILGDHGLSMPVGLSPSHPTVRNHQSSKKLSNYFSF